MNVLKVAEFCQTTAPWCKNVLHHHKLECDLH